MNQGEPRSKLFGYLRGAHTVLRLADLSQPRKQRCGQ